MSLIANALGRNESSFRISLARNCAAIWAHVNWLTEPVRFPGKWPVSVEQQERYNKEDEITPHDRRPPDPDALLARVRGGNAHAR